jgi:hypothetical protein
MAANRLARSDQSLEIIRRALAGETSPSKASFSISKTSG